MSFSIRTVCTVILTLCQLTLSWLPTHCLLPNPQQGGTCQATIEGGAISLSKTTLLLQTEVGSKTKCQQKQRQVHCQSPAPPISVAARESVNRQHRRHRVHPRIGAGIGFVLLELSWQQLSQTKAKTFGYVSCEHFVEKHKIFTYSERIEPPKGTKAIQEDR